jgi:hypothetical protein
MALGYAPSQAGTSARKIVDITTDGAYAAGGYTLTARSLGANTLLGLAYVGGTAAFVPSFNPSTSKLQFYKTGSATSGVLLEAGNNEATLSGAVWRFEVLTDQTV